MFQVFFVQLFKQIHDRGTPCSSAAAYDCPIYHAHSLEFAQEYYGCYEHRCVSSTQLQLRIADLWHDCNSHNNRIHIDGWTVGGPVQPCPVDKCCSLFAHSPLLGSAPFGKCPFWEVPRSAAAFLSYWHAIWLRGLFHVRMRLKCAKKQKTLGGLRCSVWFRGPDRIWEVCIALNGRPRCFNHFLHAFLFGSPVYHRFCRDGTHTQRVQAR